MVKANSANNSDNTIQHYSMMILLLLQLTTRNVFEFEFMYDNKHHTHMYKNQDSLSHTCIQTKILSLPLSLSISLIHVYEQTTYLSLRIRRVKPRLLFLAYAHNIDVPFTNMKNVQTNEWLITSKNHPSKICVVDACMHAWLITSYPFQTSPLHFSRQYL